MNAMPGKDRFAGKLVAGPATRPVSNAHHVVGPNAIIQTGEALRNALGRARQRAMFKAAGLTAYVDTPPSAMVPEDEAARLFAVITREMPRDEAIAILEDAGARTGSYILANRIPVAAQRFIRLLPRGIAKRVLLAAIVKHAWTFAGSGKVSAGYGLQLSISIRDNPLPTPGWVLSKQLVKTDCGWNVRSHHAQS